MEFTFQQQQRNIITSIIAEICVCSGNNDEVASMTMDRLLFNLKTIIAHFDSEERFANVIRNCLDDHENDAAKEQHCSLIKKYNAQVRDLVLDPDCWKKCCEWQNGKP